MTRREHTFPFIFAQLRKQQRRQSSAGFTLIEMMVVVIIITLLAAIALPGMSRRMKSYRGKQAAEQIAALYRAARMRAMGRGSAVHVAYSAGTFTIREGIQGSDRLPGCAPLPSSSCLNPVTRWNNGDAGNQLLSTMDFTDGGSGNAFQTTLSFVNPDTFALVTSRTTLNICFSPMGSAFSDMSTVNTLQRMTTAPLIELSRDDGVGINRSVLVTPMGTTRVVVTP